jgi:predicted MPP superfamily phosphohydrolase
LIQLLIILALDFYVFSGLLSWFKKPRGYFKKAVLISFWLITVISYAVPMYYRNQSTAKTGQFPFSFVFAFFLAWFLVKFTYALVLLINDLFSLVKYAIKYTKNKKATKNLAVSKEEESTVPTLSRSQFLLKTGALVAAAPAAAMTVGIVSGAHDYRVRRETVKIKGLPKSFHGMTLAQISDIHSGSFWNKTAVKGGVELLMAEKPDLVCFTGDLVNNAAEEMSTYMNVFDKVKAPLGVYSVIGNHDYGNYVRWDSKADKEKNFADFLKVHKNLGWNLMLNENKIFTQGGESLALIGVENWSNNKRFPSTGDLIKAKKGTEEAAAKILMSHDPTHWRAEVLKEHKDIGLTMSGHTHGMQFGIETENFKWSPVQYLYPEWAGLYQEGNQNLYVNRGYGYLGFPGRFGILPEITILTLERA